MSLDPTSGPHFEFGQFGKIVQVPCGRKKKIRLRLIYPASRVSVPIFLGTSKETLLAPRVRLIRPHPNNRSINHFQGKLLLCFYS